MSLAEESLVAVVNTEDNRKRRNGLGKLYWWLDMPCKDEYNPHTENCAANLGMKMPSLTRPKGHYWETPELWRCVISVVSRIVIGKMILNHSSLIFMMIIKPWGVNDSLGDYDSHSDWYITIAKWIFPQEMGTVDSRGLCLQRQSRWALPRVLLHKYVI